MRFTRADMLRLMWLYVLTYVAVTALAVVVARTLAVDVRFDVIPIAATLLLIGTLISQRHVIAPVIPGGLKRSTWWLSFLFGLVLVAATALTIAFLGFILFTLPGAPFAEWWDANGETTINAIRKAIEAPLFDPEEIRLQLIFWLAAAIGNLLLFWPLGSLLSRRTNRPGRPYIVAMAATVLLADSLPSAVLDHGPAVVAEHIAPVAGEMTELAVFTSLFGIAILVAVLNSLVISFALSSIAAPPPNSKDGNKTSGADTASQPRTGPPKDAPDTNKPSPKKTVIDQPVDQKTKT
ncbi:MAG: hypothetical protein AAFV69_13945 [Pseudomonadota bacterium]